MPRVYGVVSWLAMHAPVVVIGPAEPRGEVGGVVAAGAADYVARDANCLESAVVLIQKRLRQARLMTRGAASFAESQRENESSIGNEGFGEVLRHELNNPLTGILGNAELLLAEVRRKSDVCLPPGGQQRLETIAALAGRPRGATRRLSEHWGAPREPVHRADEEERKSLHRAAEARR